MSSAATRRFLARMQAPGGPSAPAEDGELVMTHYDRAAEAWIALCRVYGIATQARTRDEALHALDGARLMYLGVCRSRGVRASASEAKA